MYPVFFRYVWSHLNKWLRIIASIGLTSLAALNTYHFLVTRNDWRAAAAAALSFEIMYVAAAWTLRLPIRWRWLSSDAAVIVSGILCSTAYNILNHVNNEIIGVFSPWQWKVALSFIMSLLLTVPALVLMLSVHGNNRDSESFEITTSTAAVTEAVNNLRAQVDQMQSNLEDVTRLNLQYRQIQEVLALIRQRLNI